MTAIVSFVRDSIWGRGNVADLENQQNAAPSIFAPVTNTVSTVTSVFSKCLSVASDAVEDTTLIGEVIKGVGNSIIVFGPWIAPTAAIVKVFQENLSIVDGLIDSVDLIPSSISLGRDIKQLVTQSITGKRAQNQPKVNKLAMTITTLFVTIGVADWALWFNHLKLVSISAVNCTKLLNVIRGALSAACVLMTADKLDATLKSINHEQLVRGMLSYSAWGLKSLAKTAIVYSIVTGGSPVTTSIAALSIVGNALAIADRVYYRQNRKACDALPVGHESCNWFTGRGIGSKKYLQPHNA